MLGTTDVWRRRNQTGILPNSINVPFGGLLSNRLSLYMSKAKGQNSFPPSRGLRAKKFILAAPPRDYHCTKNWFVFHIAQGDFPNVESSTDALA